jgi:hypothetical protein
VPLSAFNQYKSVVNRPQFSNEFDISIKFFKGHLYSPKNLPWSLDYLLEAGYFLIEDGLQ